MKRLTWEKMGQYSLLALFVVLMMACNFISSAVEKSQQEPAAAAQPQANPAAAQPPTAAGTGQTYYVATDGSDGGDGSVDSPWQTLQFAADQVLPGDTILVQSGAYAGLRIERSGTAEGWITLTSGPEGNVLINRPGPNNQHDSNVELETWEGDGTVSYWVIEGLEVANAPNWGIDTRGSDSAHSHHIIIRGNKVHDNGLGSETTGIFFAFTDDVEVSGNESYNNGEHGIYLSNSGDRFWVQGNLLHDNYDCGLHMNGDESQGGDGIISGGLVEANIIYENGTGGCSAINMDGVTDTVIRNNLIYQNHAGGISIYQQDGAVCSQRDRILNNTIVMAEDGRWAINLSDAGCIDNQIFNNVILTYHESRGSILIPQSNIEGFESDYNALMDRFSDDDDESVIDLAAWQSLGYDEHSFVADPDSLFADSGSGDYRPANDSPIVDAGINLPDVTEDLLGASRPAGASTDIGAYESGGLSQESFLPAVPGAPSPATAKGGNLTYSYSGSVYRLAAQEGAVPENISQALDGLASGSGDELLDISPDGAWLVLDSERFDPECEGWSCLVLVPGDLSQGEAVRASGQVVHPEGFSAIASGGNLIIFPASDGPHPLDLWAISRSGSDWSQPQLLTADSPYDFNDRPAISADGGHVLFDCGDVPYAGEGSAICEVASDGTGFRTVLTTADGPAGTSNTGALHSADYAPDGSIVFEGDWGGEQLWRLPAGASQPALIAPEFTNDNSPCVLPDGRIASLWLNREGGRGFHELKIMSPDGAAYFLAVADLDIDDIGLGCGG